MKYENAVMCFLSINRFLDIAYLCPGTYAKLIATGDRSLIVVIFFLAQQMEQRRLKPLV